MMGKASKVKVYFANVACIVNSIDIIIKRPKDLVSIYIYIHTYIWSKLWEEINQTLAINFICPVMIK